MMSKVFPMLRRDMNNGQVSVWNDSFGITS